MGEAGMDGEGGHLLAVGGDAAVVKRAEVGEEAAGLGHGPGGRGRQGGEVVAAPEGKVEREGGEVGGEDLGRGEGLEAPFLAARPEAPAGAGGDTAGAAREVAESGDLTMAAISPPLAAETYGLEVLQRDVEDEEHNTTRFVVLSPSPERVDPGQGPVVTSFIFNVRNLPAALYKALGGFATNGVNMTKLESYMVGGHFAATQFLAEVDGHPDDLGLSRALEELTFFTTEVKVLGVYPADPFRLRPS